MVERNVIVLSVLRFQSFSSWGANLSIFHHENMFRGPKLLQRERVQQWQFSFKQKQGWVTSIFIHIISLAIIRNAMTDEQAHTIMADSIAI